jgi:hypothetical protein
MNWDAPSLFSWEPGMIWISRGQGGWAFWIPLIFVLVPVIANDYLHVLPQKNPAFGLAFGALGLAAGLVTAALGFYLNRGPGLWTIDSATGLRYFDKSAKHSLYFVPMQYWGLFYCVLVITIALLNR